MARWLMAAVFFLALEPAHAGEPIPPVCSEKEPRDVCEIMIQRNDAYNQVAIEKRKQQLMEETEDKLRLYWKQYSIGASATAEYWERYVNGLPKSQALVKLPNGKLAYPMQQ